LCYSERAALKKKKNQKNENSKSNDPRNHKTHCSKAFRSWESLVKKNIYYHGITETTGCKKGRRCPGAEIGERVL
jgi:hypothetical protein